MPRFKDAASIESTVWDMKLSDQPRSSNRALIDWLFNGGPPYTPGEVAQNRINTNVNFLEGTRIAQDARRKFNGAFMKPGRYLNARLDYGPLEKRQLWGEIITTELNREMKRSLRYKETLRSVFAQVVLHGVGPVAWQNKDSWCPLMYGMADVLLPSRTLRSMENLQYFSLFKRYTAAELYEQTSKPKRDKGWQMDTVKAALAWVGKQRGRTISGNDQIYSPEKIVEDFKSDTGYFASDQVPTIDCWDFYYLENTGKEYGWKRRIVLDTPTTSDVATIDDNTKNIIGGRDQFLYTSGDQNYAADLSEIVHFQFADGNVVAPFRYHSVRSLGFLLYAVCHLQNRLRCKFNDHVFESLLQYFRVSNPDDAARLQKVDLINLGIVPEGLTMVPPNERFQIQEGVVSQAMSLNRSTIADNATGFTQDFGLDPDKQQQEKTATQVAAEVNASAAMVGGMLQDAYDYQDHQYVEICRRFCKKNSNDPSVRRFRAAVLRQGVPEEMIDVNKWDVSAERVIGNGNKQVELAQTNLLMTQYDKFDPDSQRIILRQYTFAAVDDPALAARLVPEQREQVTDSVHDAQVSAAALLLALPMGFRQGVNHGEYAATLLGLLNVEIQKIKATDGGVGTPQQVAGLMNLAGQTIEGQPIPGNGAFPHIQVLAQQKSRKQEVKQLTDVLGKLMNEIKAMQQRQAEQQQQQQNGNGNQLSPETATKLKEQLILTEAKAAASKASHDQKMQQRQETHEMDMANRLRSAQVQETATDLKTAGEIRRGVKQQALESTESVSA